MSRALRAAVAAAAAAAGSSAASSPISGRAGPIPEKYQARVPQSDQWVSIEEGIEWLPAADLASDPNSAAKSDLPDSIHRQLKTLSDPYKVQPFVNGDEEYDEAQQAWRFLGFMYDCEASYDDDGNSWDGGTGEGCTRFLMWAAYVDLDYEGGGIGEYQYWDRGTESWDTTPCKYDEGGGDRCAKMDCHLDDTNWSLLGFFKHVSYDDWMEQLFKHEGYCVWSDEEYAFMSSARKTWPRGCDYAGEANEGYSVYYDLKPLGNGGMTIGLYTDTKCIMDYTGSTSAEDLLGNVLIDGGSGQSGDQNYDFSSEYPTLEDSLSAWDKAFDAWRICQPCLAHDLENVGYSYDDDSMRGNNYGKYWYGSDDNYNDGYNENGADFDCYDQADYTNVNQCMKFMAKTYMQSATFRDLNLASTEGTMVEYVTSEGFNARRNTKAPPSVVGTSIFFLFSTMLTAYSGILFYKARRDAKNLPQLMEQPLTGIWT